MSSKSSNDPETPVYWLTDECLPDVSHLDDTDDSPLPGSMPATPGAGGSTSSRFTFLQSSQLTSSSPAPGVKLVDLSESVFVPERWLDARYFPEITLLDVTGESSPMEVTPGGVLENNRPSLEPSGSHAFDPQSPNVTRDIRSSSAASQISTSDAQCNTSSNNVTLELRADPPVTPGAAEAHGEDPTTSLDAEFTSKETSGSSNNTLTSLQSSQLSSSISFTATARIPQNTTLDLPPRRVNPPEAERRAASVRQNATETSLVTNQTLSPDVQSAAVDGRSLHKPSGETFSGDAGDAIVCLQNDTFDAMPKQYDTFISAEKSESDGCRNTFDASTPVFRKSTSSPKEIDSEARHKETLSGPSETRDRSGPPSAAGLSGSLGHRNTDVENDDANSFKLDDTLDLRADILMTSTPMATCNMFSVGMQEGRPTVAQRRLDGASQPDGQFPSDGPSNVACERKTFLRPQAAKSRLPTPRGASQLLRHKSASALPGRFDALRSGQRPQTSGLSASNNRASTIATNPRTHKQPLSRGVLPITKGKKIDAAEIPTACSAVSGARALKRPASSQRAPLVKAKGHDCANCVTLQHRLKILSEENGKLKEELLKEKKRNYAIKKEKK